MDFEVHGCFIVDFFFFLNFFKECLFAFLFTASLGGKPWGEPWNFFSAVCWLYGKNIHKALNVPIGLLDTNWGGTPVEAWSSPDALAKCNIT